MKHTIKDVLRASFMVLCRKKTIALFLVICCVSQVKSQVTSTKNYYETAQKDLSDKKYSAALESFNKILNANPSSQYHKNAQFLKALCLFKLNQSGLALETLEKYSHNSVESSKNPNYLFAKAALIQNSSFESSLLLLRQLPNSSFWKTKQNKLTNNELPRFTDKDLSKIATNFPELKELSNFPKVRLLPSKYKSDISQLPYWPSNHSRNFDTLKIAFLAPFGKEINAQNQYAYEYLQGALLALESLKKVNIPIAILLYDVQNDTAALSEILQNKQFQACQLIIGPFFNNTLPWVQYYAESTNTIQVNPFSHSNLSELNNNFSFQESASLATLSNYSLNKLSENFVGETALIAGPGASDSLLALSIYAQLAKKHPKTNLYYWSRIGKQSIKTKPNQVIYICSNIETKLSQYYSIQKKFASSEHIVFLQKSKKETFDALGKYSTTKVICQEYADEKNIAFIEFKDLYFKKFHSLSNTLSYQAHDALLFWAKQTFKYKNKTNFMLQGSHWEPNILVKNYYFQANSTENLGYFVIETSNGSQVLIDK
jgi:hypothetical protein